MHLDLKVSVAWASIYLIGIAFVNNYSGKPRDEYDEEEKRQILRSIYRMTLLAGRGGDTGIKLRLMKKEIMIISECIGGEYDRRLF